MPSPRPTSRTPRATSWQFNNDQPPEEPRWIAIDRGRALAAWLGVIAWWLLVPGISPAAAKPDPRPGSGALTAKQIVDKALDHSYIGQRGSRARIRMVLTGGRGSKRVRDLTVWTRRDSNRARSLVRITAPPDVAGTSFLLRERAGGGDDMWLYIPSLKRTRRIVGKARQGRFLGSDFTYADLEARVLRDASYRRLPDGRVGSHPCYVIEARPKPGSGSAYRRVQAWIRKKDFVAIRLKMYDSSDKLFKVLFVRRLGRSGGRPIVKETRMVDRQNGTSTLLQLLGSRPLGPRSDQLFTVRNLARGL